jgi:hypothetical protein
MNRFMLVSRQALFEKRKRQSCSQEIKGVLYNEFGLKIHVDKMLWIYGLKNHSIFLGRSCDIAFRNTI